MKKILLILIVANVLIRLINIGMPLLEGSATRQIYDAMVAKHFYQESMNILYPAISINGNTPFFQALELQLLPFIGAICYHALGGIHTEALRILSILFMVLAMIVLYKLIKSMFSEELALITTFIFSFSPMSIYLGRSANFEMAIIFFNIATIYYFYKWVKTESFIYALLANISFILSVSLKLPTLYLLLPMFVMAYPKWRWGFLKKNWLMFFSFIVIAAWQGWESYLRLKYPHINWLHFNLSYNLDSIRMHFTSLESYKKVYGDALNYVLTPLGLVFCIIGLLLRNKSESDKILLYWLLAVTSFYVVMPEGLVAHGYYHIHYLPMLAFFAAKGFLFATKRDYSKFYFSNWKILMLVFGLIFILLSARYSVSCFTVPENKRYVLPTAQIVKEKIKPDELIISCVDSPGVLLYYSDRKGWPMDFSARGKEGIPILEGLRSKGAGYLVCAYKKELEDNKEFMDYLRLNYKTIFENYFCMIIDLKE